MKTAGWKKSLIQWEAGKSLYMSIPFSWQMREAEKLAKCHNGPVVIGGPAAILNPPEWARTEASTPYDVLSMHNPMATFTTRGCPNKCKFCAVPKIEGDFIELESWKAAPIICDNNLLACSVKHFEKVIKSLKPFPEPDFNQGLDARLFTKFHAQKIATLKDPMLRFAVDRTDQLPVTKKAIETARESGLRRFHVYVLVGYNDTPEDAISRLETIRGWGIRPNPMRYQPLDAKRKNEYLAPTWTNQQMIRTTKYYSRLRYFEHIPFENFRWAENNDLFSREART